MKAERRIRFDAMLVRAINLLRVFSLLVAMLVQPSGAHAWHPWIRTLGQEPGHPAHNVYSMHVDQVGYLWLSTSDGVLRYDGVRFEEVSGGTMESGTLVLMFQEDTLHRRLWMATTTGAIHSWDHAADRMRYHGVGQGAHGSLTKVRTMLPTRDGGLLIGYGQGIGLDHLTASGEWRRAEVPDPRSGLHIVGSEDGPVFYANWMPPMDSVVIRVDLGAVSGATALPMDLRSGWGTSNAWLVTRAGMPVVALGDELCWWNARSGLVRHHFDKYVLRMFEDRRGNVWVLEYLGRIHCFDPSGKPLAVELPHLVGAHATDIVEDKDGGLWISTLGGGITYCRPFEVERLPMQSDFPSFTAMALAPDGGLLTGDLHGALVLWDSTLTMRSQWSLGGPARSGEGAAEVKGVAWCGTHERPEAAAPFVLAHVAFGALNVARTQRFYASYAYQQVHLGGDSLLVINPYGVMLLPEGAEGPLVELRRGGRMFHAEQWKDTLWLAGTDGLFALDRGRRLSGPVVRASLTDVVVWREELIVSALDSGLLRRSAQGVWERWTPHPWARNARDLFVDDDGVLWLATAKGVVGLDGNGHVAWRSDALPGVPLNGADRVVAAHGKVWVLAHRTIVRYARMGAYPTRLADAPSFVGAAAKGRPLEVSNGLTLDVGERDLTLYFRTAMPYRLGSEAYRMRIGGEHAPWSLLDVPRVDVFNLSPGIHRMEVQAASIEGGWSPSGILDFTVPPYLHERWWFRALSALLAVLLLVGAISWYLRRARRRTMEQHLMAQLQLRALSAQLEPHFVFNALNGIQNYLATKDRASAMRYLARFSRLMRGLLDAGQARVISLSEECSMLEHYCHLEALRYDPPFQWSITVHPGISPATTGVLPYLVQPFVENALRHGLRHRSAGSEKRLTVVFQREGADMLLCTIEDNGVGMAESERLGGQRERMPTGMAANKERLRLIAQGHSAYGVHVEDLHDSAGAPCGTRVVLKMPILRTAPKVHGERDGYNTDGTLERSGR